MKRVHHPRNHLVPYFSLFAIVSALMMASGSAGVRAAGQVPVETAAVMAPLLIEPSGMGTFESLLDEAKAADVNAVSVDVWWGVVEGTGDQTFDWTYYDQVFQKIRDRGLKIVAILSFHKCGGGPGDDCDIPLPGWLGNHFSSAGLSAIDLQYETDLNGRHWWVGLIPNAPDTSMFTFNNPNGWEGGPG